MEDFRRLLVEIAQCPRAKAVRCGETTASDPCFPIVASQKGSAFQIPEPWSGEINIAPILFISSNPSIDELEEYPGESWELDRTADFFQNRFTSPAGWVTDGKYALRRDGTRSAWVRFWASARGRASEILQKKKAAIRPGVDFALTEVVHCKSRNETGVAEAQAFCSQRYLKRILSVAAAKVILVYGDPASKAITRCLGLGDDDKTSHGLFGPVPMGGISRMFVFLPHPNARGPKKTLEANLGDGLTLVRQHLA